jgi:FAD/FMN-containing dehydrogenase/Fe-S oxidoreductase
MVPPCSPPAQVHIGPGAVPIAMNDSPTPREIPFNYTSADDRQAISQLLGPAVWQKLEELRARRVTGRSARLLMRFFGEILIHRRNPFLFQELVDSRGRRQRFFGNIEKDLAIVDRNANGESRVLEVLEECRSILAGFRAEVEGAPELRRRMTRELGAIVGKDNVLFDPFTIVSHATDATDWRLHLPVAVIMPDDEAQVAPALAAIARLGLKAVPRGAGTGLTGGAVPLRPGCVVVNTEKLNRIRALTERTFRLAGGAEAKAQVLELEAGVITEKAMEHAAERGLVFATDPTSAWACTIGGNVAENAGGKDCVLYGTCIDNLVAWRMAMPSGRRWTVRRTDHQLRKILPDDTVTFEVEDEGGGPARRIELRGSEIRKKGLWKDITNKALGGVPGLQKEGTDGVITAAEFVLYPEYEAKRTLCLEFFGPDFDEASRVILELSRAFPFPNGGHEALSALEHFDDEYVRAINYKVKAPRAETPRAVLLVDVVGHAPSEAERGVERIQRILDAHPNTLMFEARDAAEGKRFWADRKKLGAIARRTNAFKMNEDVVLPLEALAEFARFVERMNVEEERFSQTRFVERAQEVLRDAAPPPGDPEWLAAKIPTALERFERAREAIAAAGEAELRSLAILRTLHREVSQLVRGYTELARALERAHDETRERLIVLATHMHAGDGNVHVNVPVLSNDRPMLQRTERVIDRVMEKVLSLGGVVSGEHGIGVTKLRYLETERILALSAHRREVDPGALMNPGKLEDLEVLDRIFTPSFNLLELEARILQHGQLEELAKAIAHCVRCGKCKPDCCVYHPARGMFFHPRNKNLAIGSLIEALLYDAQRAHSTRFELLRWLEEVADHCTGCHKCLKPCPVDIDSGEVSVLEKRILASWGYKSTSAATRAVLSYLDSRSPAYNALFRSTVVRLGGAVQRAGCGLAAPLQPADGRPGAYPLQMLRSPVNPVPAKTLRDVIPACEPDQVLVFEPDGEAQRTVFYFPGCGSERLQSSVSMAALHVLVSLGARVVLPPPFLCCGYPAHFNARTDQHSRHVLRDTIIFSQIREMFSYLEFDACVVTCGTCREALDSMEAGKIFGGRLVDVAAYAEERGLRFERPPTSGGGPDFLYHAPCHDSLGGKGEELLVKLGAFGVVTTVPHCCSEAGTLALSRPDITDAMLHRKRGALEEALHGRRGATILTNCPSCVQGLGRNRAMGVEPLHLAVALATRLSGERWIETFRAQAAKAHAVHF